MGHKSSKESVDQKSLKKSSRDIRLLVLDETDTIHTVVVPKALLLEHSVVFREMVRSGGKSGKLKKIQLQDVRLIGVLKLMQYVENGNVSFDKVSEIAETLRTAEKYKIESIEDVCIEYLNTAMNASNVCEIYELCVQKEFSDIIYKCLKVIDSNAEEVLESDSFLELSIHSVGDIIKRNSLNISNETTVYNAVLKWGEAELSRKGSDISNIDELKRLIKPLLIHVHFHDMSLEKTEGAEMEKFRMSLSELKVGFAQESSNSLSQQSRSYVDYYTHHFEVFESPQASIVNGENFCLTIEVLKGKVFFCGVNLAVTPFSARMSASCLYAILCCTNKRTREQKRVRGTFLNTEEVSSLVFATPLYIKDNDKLEVQLNVKMAGNVSPLTRRNDVEIIVPDTKDIAMKILAQETNQSNVRCIFKDIIYFF